MENQQDVLFLIMEIRKSYVFYFSPFVDIAIFKGKSYGYVLFLKSFSICFTCLYV